jgi:hypothetical protein
MVDTQYPSRCGLTEVANVYFGGVRASIRKLANLENYGILYFHTEVIKGFMTGWSRRLCLSICQTLIGHVHIDNA